VAGEWIKVEKSTPDKPEVLRIARELSIDRDAVFGKLMLVWMWFDANSVDGVVDGAVDEDVDALVRHPGFAISMRSVKWLETTSEQIGKEGLRLPNFDRHNGETAKKRALKSEYQARWRSKLVEQETSTTLLPREEKRREDIKETVAPKNGAHHKAVDNSPVFESLPLIDGSQFQVRQSLLDQLSPLYPAVDVQATVREMKGWLLLNPHRRKTPRGVKSFIGKWLQGEQEKHGG
jgi:hypothetical protein